MCITAHVHGKYVTVVDVLRRKMQFPDLLKCAASLALQHNAKIMLVEDAASGSQLIQTLRTNTQIGVPMPIARKPEGDKVSRVAGISAMIEAGQLTLPVQAPWLAEFKAELLAFPNARFDDQVDALSQMLIWVRRTGSEQIFFGAPILIEPYGEYRSGWDDDGGYDDESDDRYGCE